MSHSPFIKSFVSLLCFAALYGGVDAVRAADHGDAPNVAGDQACDLGDVYFFLDPNDNTQAVLIMTVRGMVHGLTATQANKPRVPSPWRNITDWCPGTSQSSGSPEDSGQMAGADGPLGELRTGGRWGVLLPSFCGYPIRNCWLVPAPQSYCWIAAPLVVLR